jgi:putative transposase
VLIEAELSWVISATVGDLQLQIPKLQTGSVSLFAVIMEAYLHGTGARKVGDLVKALGADSGITKPEVSRSASEP